VCGGIRTVRDVELAFMAGADKVAINTAAIIGNPALITEIAHLWGSQACVVSVEAKKTATGWEAYIDGGRERTGRDVVAWVREAVDRGAGEVLLTSIDRDGTRKGMDLDLVRAASADLTVPVVASGGAGSADDVAAAFGAGAAAVACGSLLHMGVETVGSLKAALRALGVLVREAA
jgi:cyclase